MALRADSVTAGHRSMVTKGLMNWRPEAEELHICMKYMLVARLSIHERDCLEEEESSNKFIIARG